MKSKRKTKLFEWQQRCFKGEGHCGKCGRTDHLTVDHIVPVFVLQQFMLDRIDVLYDMEENFEILCRYCNQYKSSRIDPRNPKVYEILEKVLKEAKEYHLKYEKQGNIEVPNLEVRP